jgi:hypothetical protein
MDQLVTLLKEKTGIDDATANRVAEFIKDNIHELPKLLGGNMDTLTRGFMGNTGEGGNNPIGGIMDAAKGVMGNKD